ncbi:DUF4157 domain-containing protein [Pseudobacteroides cellulosolvens]|uniref:eCIS core domain-containing protein n=1 Tax=Pseudobacteroides cellulosolvens ATCC 35603 = DSM 2933 TaxID=398512 RepID=A0A0L6JIR2_9FIRM|nr:DUF4157 domain-containing protein [Pseudobacteroides cellulosolvens]KNY25342.1 protein of unknown function DUF4157 [Pseudobacteroides cellulosolvens ATCC 35603 = DSM 2933]
MFENKSLKRNEGDKQVSASNKNIQRKSNSTKLIQRAVLSQNNLVTGDTAQFKKLVGNHGLNNLFSTKPLQREVSPDEEEESLQMKKDSNAGYQTFVNLENTRPLQRVADPEEEEEPLQMKKENNTGMPDQLKSGVESISGIDMSDVRVHYNSDKPAQVGALAYTQGTDIHVASGQEKHLAHEAWHVVQQAQGRVQPTMQLRDVAVNDDPGLEHEADVMGSRALSI